MQPMTTGADFTGRYLLYKLVAPAFELAGPASVLRIGPV